MVDNKGESLAFWLNEFFDNIFYSYHYVVIALCLYLFGVGAAGIMQNFFLNFKRRKTVLQRFIDIDGRVINFYQWKGCWTLGEFGISICCVPIREF